MQEKIRLEQTVIVEGRYDKIKLDAVLDAVIIPVNGFSIFTDEPLKKLVLKMAQEKGIIVLMDSDAAGFKIRGFLRGIIPKGQIIDIYIPDVLGKERRKTTASKEGKLGVEGIDVKTLRRLFEEAGVSTGRELEADDVLTQQDFLLLGLSGAGNSSKLRSELFKKLNLPERISTKSSIEIINHTIGKKRFLELLDKLK